MGGNIRAEQQRREKQLRILEYNKNPLFCLKCKTPLSYERQRQCSVKIKGYGFCNESCAGLYYGEQRSLKTNTHICEKCGESFYKFIPKNRNRKIHCPNCISKHPHRKENISSILELSKRTVAKILKRANKGCSICDWKEESCDIHHIISKKKHGSDDINNLVILCPNHHRLAGKNKINIEDLQKISINKTFNNWKEFYLT